MVLIAAKATARVAGWSMELAVGMASVPTHAQHGDDHRDLRQRKRKADHHEVGRDFEERIAEEEDPGAKTVDRRAEAQAGIHLH
jgi:hypothetical protein